MKVGIIGCGFIGTTLAKAIEEIDEIDAVYLLDHSISRAEELAASLKKATPTSSLDSLLDNAELVIESASQEAVRTYAQVILERGRDLMIMSIGALVDEPFWDSLKRIAKKNNCRIYLPSGAICSIDGIKSASIADVDEVTLITTKPPLGFKGVRYVSRQGIDLSSLTKPLTLFEGTAGEAVKHFPKNVNVAATLSIAGIGFQRTKVKIIADPRATRNVHKIIVRGRFGEFTTELSNVPSLTNPKTSYLAVLSAIATLKKIVSGVWIGT